MADIFMQAAIAQAKKSAAEGGIPIGSVLIIDNEIVSAGHNQRLQKGSCILHAEMDCLENAGRLSAADYKRATFILHYHRAICVAVRFYSMALKK